MTSEIRVGRDDWPEECKRLHRQGFSIKNLRVDGGNLVATVEERSEKRPDEDPNMVTRSWVAHTEQPDGSGGASREVTL